MWRVLYWVTAVLYETSKLNTVQLCIDCSHFCKQHFLECVNIPEPVNNSMQLGFSFPFHFKVSCTNQLLTLLVQHKYKQERTWSIVASKSHHYKAPMRKLARNYNSRVLIKLPPFKLQGTSEHIYIKVEIL